MNISDTMHPAQVAILHGLLFCLSVGFAQLQKASQLESDHFNFHLQKMIGQKLIAKNTTGYYHLTTLGKEYANRFDTDARMVERQPKVAVLLREFEGGRNAWMTLAELRSQDKVFDGMEEAYQTVTQTGLKFKENRHFYTQEDY